MISPYHHAPSNSPLSKVLWHPLSTQSTSLLVLTLDGLLREYDPLTDAEEPQQQLSLLPPRMGGRGYGVDEPGEREAVSFCLGRGEGDWGWLSVYGLMANGDVYGVCPFLPKNALVLVPNQRSGWRPLTRRAAFPFSLAPSPNPTSRRSPPSPRPRSPIFPRFPSLSEVPRPYHPRPRCPRLRLRPRSLPRQPRHSRRAISPSNRISTRSFGKFLSTLPRTRPKCESTIRPSPSFFIRRPTPRAASRASRARS